MDRNTIRKEIIALVSNIKNQSDVLWDEQYPSQLELELFLHKVEKLYQKSIVFNHLSVFDGFEETETIPLRAVNSETSAEKKEDMQQEMASDPQLRSQPDKLPEPATVPLEPSPLVHKPVSQKSAIPDLKSVIGINDKFQFTNELFKGNMQEFNIAIEQLSAAETVESALNYLESLRQLYDWEDENETLKRLLNIVNRRYS